MKSPQSIRSLARWVLAMQAAFNGVAAGEWILYVPETAPQRPARTALGSGVVRA